MQKISKTSQLGRQNMSRQIISDKFVEVDKLPFELKTGPCQIRTQDLCRPRYFRCLQTNFAGTLKNLNS